MSWQFWEYITVSGEGAVSEWLRSLRHIEEDVKAALDARLQIAQPLPILDRPFWGKLSDKHGAHCKGLYELRFKAANGDVICRPLCCTLPGYNLVILVGAIEKGGRLLPRGVCKTAQNRVAQLDQQGRLRRYEFK